MNRAARNIRRGSSVKETSAGKGVRSLLAARSADPVERVDQLQSGRERAMALTVKSRRDRSASRPSRRPRRVCASRLSYSSAR